MDKDEMGKIFILRKILAPMGTTESMEFLLEKMKNTKHTYAESRCKQAYYLSMEFLMGRATGNAAFSR